MEQEVVNSTNFTTSVSSFHLGQDLILGYGHQYLAVVKLLVAYIVVVLPVLYCDRAQRLLPRP